VHDGRPERGGDRAAEFVKGFVHGVRVRRHL
jgi:hypothetical protein